VGRERRRHFWKEGLARAQPPARVGVTWPMAQQHHAQEGIVPQEAEASEAQRWSELRSLCPFRLVSDEDLPQLAGETALRVAEAETVIFTDGDPGEGVSTVIDGSVEISKAGRVLGLLGAGATFGEVSLFVRGSARTATARAATRVRLVTWRAEDVEERLARHERLATAIVADLAHVLAERLDRRTQDVVALLEAAGTRLPVAELERLRSRMVQ
jgi:CRP-like cAMP-binding protein